MLELEAHPHPLPRKASHSYIKRAYQLDPCRRLFAAPVSKITQLTRVQTRLFNLYM